MRILAIDDDPYLLRLYPRALKHHDVVAIGPSEALELVVEDRDFDVVLCDLNMPRVDGQWFHDCLMERASELADRVVFCTGGACSTEGWKILERSPERVVYKPFDGRQLRAAIDRFAPSPPPAA